MTQPLVVTRDVAAGAMATTISVLSSAGRNYDIDFILKAPNGAILKEIPDEEDGSYKTMIMRKGVYTLCFDNGFSKFTSKQLYLELTIVQRGEWKKYMEMQREQIIAEVNAIEGEVVASAMENVTEAMIDKLDYIADHMDSISFLQGTGRRRAIRDWHLANSNHSYIQKWSIAQCIVIVSASVFQVFLLRRMFNIKAVTPTQKPRA
ncbi:transmembrane emp24 domain-containing protein 6-like [Saccoglossus kowalevskii]|uniref:Transmembrane emp24 domain-containing protein 6-like n=1 Tax=Saccoglossus kowalevskii TaxID=10224 RepID=A0ABM0MSI6_SACKO|nr:PREDICTED: transmembrane emp24 domain-containing protein 6-like [Saccoglossus kowalevskii]